ncbi:hypothetical protein [Symbioplanes lichenis]|uniref:hypothetical protein n=1 Tax=Symbioplanes lichenis TaxID=1629072 RepID=UPI0027382BA7|nr:hypothetical protein [Actinoplanes lichenis]
MARIDITGDALVITLEGLDVLWALKKRLTIPLAHVRGATPDPGIVRGFKGVRTKGTNMPGVIVAGTFRTGEGRIFWNVRDAAKAVVIELADEEYTRLVIEAPDPRATADRIERARTPA